MVTELINHPSIVQWVVFNEGWGEYAPDGVVSLVLSHDTTRLVSPASGWVDDPSGSVRPCHTATTVACAAFSGTLIALSGICDIQPIPRYCLSK